MLLSTVDTWYTSSRKCECIATYSCVRVVKRERGRKGLYDAYSPDKSVLLLRSLTLALNRRLDFYVTCIRVAVAR